VAGPVFQFQPRWKEELVVVADAGTFVLEFPMGIPTVYLPTEEEWRRRAPDWAIEHYSDLKCELEEWCSRHDFRLEIDPTADVYLP
jgi:hypothetical protein